jgi:hypothetical protein
MSINDGKRQRQAEYFAFCEEGADPSACIEGHRLVEADDHDGRREGGKGLDLRSDHAGVRLFPTATFILHSFQSRSSLRV